MPSWDTSNPIIQGLEAKGRSARDNHLTKKEVRYWLLRTRFWCVVIVALSLPLLLASRNFTKLVGCKVSPVAVRSVERQGDRVAIAITEHLARCTPQYVLLVALRPKSPLSPGVGARSIAENALPS